MSVHCILTPRTGGVTESIPPGVSHTRDWSSGYLRKNSFANLKPVVFSNDYFSTTANFYGVANFYGTANFYGECP